MSNTAEIMKQQAHEIALLRASIEARYKCLCSEWDKLLQEDISYSDIAQKQRRALSRATNNLAWTLPALREAEAWLLEE